jgi:ubiquinone/menaquinone biosynthesis C-methylase UbiE
MDIKSSPWTRPCLTFLGWLGLAPLQPRRQPAEQSSVRGMSQNNSESRLVLNLKSKGLRARLFQRLAREREGIPLMQSPVTTVKCVVKNVMPNSLLDLLREIKCRQTRFVGYKTYTNCAVNKCGIEIGGPSSLFRCVLPVYKSASSIDGVNFSTSTIWEGDISEATGFNYYKSKTGRQYIAEATKLVNIGDNLYDFVISSNCLEHIANPLKALSEWKRIVKNKGHILVLVPNRDCTFDHRREVTTFKHLYNDYINSTSEHDLSHLDEILSKHDLSMDPPAGDYEAFKSRSLDNFNNRCLHHHVFNISLLGEMFTFLGIEVIRSDLISGNFAILGKLLK